MGYASKSYLQLVSENGGHFTKSELEQRKKYEEELLTNTKIKEFEETKKNPEAHKEFLRVSKLFAKIDKNDDLFAGAINRYAIIKGEIADCICKREEFYSNLKELEDFKASGECDLSSFEYFKLKAQLQGQVVAIDKQIMSKRKMMLDIEKENLMTVASALRSIPKRPKKEEGQSEEDKLFGSNV